jgi:hypothetical protein
MLHWKLNNPEIYWIMPLWYISKGICDKGKNVSKNGEHFLHCPHIQPLPLDKLLRMFSLFGGLEYL